MTKKHKGRKVGGWLAFFIITLLVFSPLLNIFTLLADIMFYTFLDIINSIGTIILMIFVGFSLWKRRPYALELAKVYLITTLAINILYAILFFEATSFSFIYFVIWIIYLFNSKRVKDTYTHLEETKKSNLIWSKLAIIYAFLAPIYGLVFAIISLKKIAEKKMYKKTINLSVIAVILSIIMIILTVMIGFFSVMPYADNDSNTYEFFIYARSGSIEPSGTITQVLPITNTKINIGNAYNGYLVVDSNSVQAGEIIFTCDNCDVIYDYEYTYQLYNTDIVDGYVLLELTDE